MDELLSFITKKVTPSVKLAFHNTEYKQGDVIAYRQTQVTGGGLYNCLVVHCSRFLAYISSISPHACMRRSTNLRLPRRQMTNHFDHAASCFLRALQQQQAQPTFLLAVTTHNLLSSTLSHNTTRQR
jgi:hypothetical protein